MKHFSKALLLGFILAFFLSIGAGINTYASEETPREIIIAQDGSGDYTTIQEGVDNAEDGDTLIICEGIYTEAVFVMNKELNFVGVNRDRCILACDTNYYWCSPLTIAAGSVSNLTIYGDNDLGLTDYEIERANDEFADVIDDEEYERQKNYKAYAVHIDQNILYGKSISFTNCKIVSETSHCIGIGTRGDCKISFKGCEIISTGDGSCIFMHDSTTSDVNGITEFEMVNCSLKCEASPYVLNFSSLMPEENFVSLTFQNVSVSLGGEYAAIVEAGLDDNLYIITSNASGMTGDGWCGLENWYLTLYSYGNSLSQMNAFPF